MPLDVLILNSGEWVLCEELAASPWHVLIYRQRGEPRNELHLWLPREGSRRSAEFAFKRYWLWRAVRWCVEMPPGASREAGVRLRFSSPDGRVLWAERGAAGGLGDLSDGELRRLLDSAHAGLYTAI